MGILDYTWHHTEISGKMQLVPTGIHNITLHNGGKLLECGQMLLDNREGIKWQYKIYCLDEQSNVVWQSEDFAVIYSQSKNLPYEQMGIKDFSIYASDFYGRNYKINVNTGKIEDCTIVK